MRCMIVLWLSPGFARRSIAGIHLIHINNWSYKSEGWKTPSFLFSIWASKCVTAFTQSIHNGLAVPFGAIVEILRVRNLVGSKEGNHSLITLFQWREFPMFRKPSKERSCSSDWFVLNASWSSEMEAFNVWIFTFWSMYKTSSRWRDESSLSFCNSSTVTMGAVSFRNCSTALEDLVLSENHCQVIVLALMLTISPA